MPGIDLQLGRFRRSSSDEDLARVITSGVPGHRHARRSRCSPRSSPASSRSSARASIRRPRPCESATPSAARRCSKARPTARSCHRVKGVGPRARAGPERHRRDPHAGGAAARAARTRPSRCCRSTGRCASSPRTAAPIRGRRLNEDTYTVQLIDDQERLHSLDKADLQGARRSRRRRRCRRIRIA